MNSVIWLAGHGTVSSLFEITTTSTTTIPKKNFRLYVNLAVAVFLAWVFYLVSCRVGCTSKYKSRIMELPNDWGHSVFRTLEKIWQMRSNLCASTNSVFGIKIENEFHRQKERPEPEKWQVLSITNIHTYTCIMQYCQLESISSTGKANINYICPSFIETYSQIPLLSSTIAHFLPYKFPCFFSRWSLSSILCLFVYADSVYVQPSKWIEISIFAFI